MFVSYNKCPLYGQAKPLDTSGGQNSASGTTKAGPLPLLDLDMVEDGLIFKQCVREAIVDGSAANQQILASEGEGDAEEEAAFGTASIICTPFLIF